MNFFFVNYFSRQLCDMINIMKCKGVKLSVMKILTAFLFDCKVILNCFMYCCTAADLSMQDLKLLYVLKQSIFIYLFIFCYFICFNIFLKIILYRLILLNLFRKMKINEKNLISFAASKTCIDREGWLGKRGEVNKSFQKRWFVLKGNLLFYFEKKDDKEPVGLVILEGCTVELAENEETYAFKLVFHGAGNRTYILCANSQETMEQWMKALASASYDYVKLMVGELQRQLDEITEMEKQAASSVPHRLKKTGLPSNRSDGCLFGHVASGGRVPRFNPFDKWKSEGNNASGSSSNITTASSEDDLLHASSRSKGSRQRYLFIELHEYYGQIFRRLFEEQKKKRAALKPKLEVDLITF